jgi:hypothetical protein
MIARLYVLRNFEQTLHTQFDKSYIDKGEYKVQHYQLFTYVLTQ